MNNFSGNDIKNVIIKVGSKSKGLQELHGNNLCFSCLSKRVYEQHMNQNLYPQG